MRAAVFTLNVLSVVLGLLCLPLVLMFGGLGILFLAYDKPGETALGLVIAATPIVVPATYILLSQYLLKRNRPASLLIAALPLIVAGALVTSRCLLAARCT